MNWHRFEVAKKWYWLSKSETPIWSEGRIDQTRKLGFENAEKWEKLLIANRPCNQIVVSYFDNQYHFSQPQIDASSMS